MTVSNASAPTGQRSARRLSWDVIRVVAVVSVIIGHITHQASLLHPELSGYPFRDTAQFGAVALLVISAYFVCSTLRKGDPGRWLWKKVARLLPAYFAAVLLTYVVVRFCGAAFNSQHFGGNPFDFLFGAPTDMSPDTTPWYVPVGGDLLVNLSMLQSWSVHFYWLDGSYWTLPVQLMAFSGAALIWPRSWRNDRTVLWLVWFLIAAPLLIRFVIFSPGHEPDWAITLIFGLGLHRIHAFAIGVGIWMWAQRRIPTWHLGLLLAGAVLAQELHMFPYGFATPIDPSQVPSIIGFAVLLLAICAAARGPDWDIPGIRHCRRGISWLAGISYGVYLVHQELGYILAKALLEIGFSGWARLVTVLIASFLAGWLLTVLVERPTHRWLTTVGQRRTPRPAPDPGRAPEPVPGVDEVPGEARKPPAPVSVGGAS